RRWRDARREPRAAAARLPLGGARRRGSALLPPSGRGPGRHRARAGGRSARAPRGAGCQHADAAAGEERLLSPRRTLSRKLREAVLALLLEARASKEEILARYVGSVYLGVDGGLPVHGFSEAAQVYFGKPLGELEPAECALLAGIIRSPNGLSPRRRPRAALARRNRVLEVMVQDGLDKSVGAEAMATPLKLAPPRARP